LIDSAANNHQRIVRMQETENIGRFAYAQQYWVHVQHYQSESWENLMELWFRFNMHLVHVIREAAPDALSHVCDIGYAHPATLRFVIEDYVRHVSHHLEQILSDVDPRKRERWMSRDPEHS
jgi:hypothetical protein